MKFTRLTTSEELLSLLEYHNSHSDFVVLDVETTSKKPREAKLIDVQLTGRGEDEVVIFGAEIAPLLTKLRKSLVIVGHNYKYDAHVLFRHEIDLLGHTWRDTLLIGHLLDENRESYSLDSYVKEYWKDSFKEKFWEKYKTYEESTEEDRTDYACRDVYYTERLYRQMLSDLYFQGIPESLVIHTHRLQASLLRTEISGIRVDLEYLEKLGVRIKGRINELDPEMRSLVKDEIKAIEIEEWQKKIDGYKSEKGKAGVCRPVFNFESSSQLSRLLYRSLRLPAQKNEKTGALSTDYASLEKIKRNHPVIELIQENRELQKIYGTYINGTLDRVDESRIYPEFRVAGTVTGRLSHSNPNLAQLPKQGGVRGIYVPDRGRKLISADYSQLEVVLEANLTGDKNLIHMLENGESKHDLTARELGCDRDTAKTLNFAMQYWCSSYKVAKLLNCSADEGKRVWDKYWDIYRGPKELKAKTDKMVDDGVPLVNLFGRKRRFRVGPRKEWDGDYRQAYNFLIQSTGADITSRAFYLISTQLEAPSIGRGLFTVHDEIIVEAKENYSGVVENMMVEFMGCVGTELGLKIPLKAVSSGPMDRWLD